MKNKKESQEADKYGKITFGEETKLLVGIIGESAILDIMSEDRKRMSRDRKRVLKDRKSYRTTLERMYKGEMPYNGFTSLQRYCEEFLKKIKGEYKVSPLVMTSFNLNPKSFIRNFSLYAESNIILHKSKKELASFLLHVQAFYCIEESLSGSLINDLFKTSEKKVLEFLTDSYDKVFGEIMQIFRKNNEAFYKQIPNKQGEDYRVNIDNWRKEKVYNPEWRTLVPVLDYLKREHISFVHRLIGLYLRKNAQKALLDVLDVSKDELKEIIENIAKMIEDKKRPENIPYDLYFDHIWLRDQRINIAKCLQFQNNYENSIDVEESNNIIKYLKRNYSHYPEGKFLYFWLQTRAKVFEKHNDLEGHREVQEEILKGYREAIDELLNDTKSPFDRHFLIEIMLINYIFYPRRVKAIKDYYEHGRITLEIFNANMSWENMFNILKEFQNTDIRKALVNIL